MINIEPEVFSTVASTLRGAYASIFVTGEPTPMPPRFPAVTITEADNSTHTRTLDTSGAENHARLMYEVNVYSDLTVGAKAQCRDIMALVDAKMFSMGFYRLSNAPLAIPNADSSIFRMVARYRGTVSKDHIMYRR